MLKGPLSHQVQQWHIVFLLRKRGAIYYYGFVYDVYGDF